MASTGDWMLTGELFKLADRHAHWLNVRQRTVAENVAHANTPNYVSKTVSAFDLASNGFQVSLSRTNKQHISPRTETAGGIGNIKISEDPGGQAVQLENEMMTALEVRRGYELNTSIVKAFNRMILSAAKG